ncbi:MAG TPA: CAP domain-containing protein [Gaiellaceae bacterium]|nr:CAP domain-containing protein [Gaiellaceae bacterium]
MPTKKHVLIVSSAVLLVLSLAGSASAATQAKRESSLLIAVNAARTAHGLKPLTVDARLTRAARAHSLRMLRTSTFSHGALAARMTASGARGPLYGENLAWGVGSRAAARTVVRQWLASPAHRRNLLRPGFRRIGVGAPVGTFAGYRGAVVVTANFAGS